MHESAALDDMHSMKWPRCQEHHPQNNTRKPNIPKSIRVLGRAKALLRQTTNAPHRPTSYCGSLGDKRSASEGARFHDDLGFQVFTFGPFLFSCVSSIYPSGSWPVTMRERAMGAFGVLKKQTSSANMIWLHLKTSAPRRACASKLKPSVCICVKIFFRRVPTKATRAHLDPRTQSMPCKALGANMVPGTRS